MTIRVKLTLWYSLTFSALLLSFGIILYQGLFITLYDQVDNSLWLLAETEAASLLDSPSGEPHIHDIAPNSTTVPNLGGKYVQLLDLDDQVIDWSNNLLGQRIVSSHGAFLSAQSGNITFETVLSPQLGNLRLISLPILAGEQVNYVLQVGSPLEGIETILRSFLDKMLISYFIGLLLVVGGGWLMAKKALEPMVSITKKASLINGANLDKRLDIKVEADEIGHLIIVLNQMFDRLEAAFLSQERFIADASHELRTPLTAIKGTQEVLLRRHRKPAEYEEGISSCLEEIDRLIRLVNNLLTLTSTNTAGGQVNFTHFDLASLINETCEQLRILMGQDEIAMSVSTPSQLSFYGDKDKIRQLILNLVQNAVRYNKKGGKIAISVAQEAGEMTFVITDSGIGIPPDKLHQIFERFYRLDPSRQQSVQNSSGLGLAISRWITDIHQGTISAQSTLGQGSTFTVRLPTATKEPNTKASLQLQKATPPVNSIVDLT